MPPPPSSPGPLPRLRLQPFSLRALLGVPRRGRHPPLLLRPHLRRHPAPVPPRMRCKLRVPSEPCLRQPEVCEPVYLGVRRGRGVPCDQPQPRLLLSRPVHGGFPLDLLPGAQT